MNGGHDAAALKEASRSVAAAGELLCIPTLGDVGDIAYVESVRKEFGPADVIISNAGIAWTGLLTDMAPDEWDSLIREAKDDPGTQEVFLNLLRGWFKNKTR